MSRFILGNCIDVMRGFPDRAVDLIVTDPPYLVGLRTVPGAVLPAIKPMNGWRLHRHLRCTAC
jgi:DNA modification methylase